MLKPSRYILLVVLFVLASLFGAGCSKESRKNRHLSRGDQNFQAEKYDKAEIEYLKVLQLAPLNPRAIRQLGIIYHEEGNGLRAHRYLEEANKLSPSDPDILLRLALNDLSLGDFRNAYSNALAVLAIQKGQPEALEVLAGCAITPKAVEDVRARVSTMMRGDQDRPGYHVAQGLCYVHLGDETNAFNEFSLALSVDPKSSTALFALGNLLWARNDTAAAEKTFKTAADLSPIRSPKRLRYAAFKLSKDREEEARQDLAAITTQAPDYLPAWNFIAELEFRKARYAECRSALDRILARDSMNFDASMLNGNLRLVQGDTTNALTAFSKMSSTYPRSALVQFQLARALLLNTETNKAVSALTQAASFDPSFTDAAMLLANLHINKGDPSRAIPLLQEVIKRQPKIPQAHILLADAYLANKSPDEAVAVCRRMSEVFPKSPEVPLMIGTLMESRTNLSQARDYFEKALTLSPGYLPALEHIVNLDIAGGAYQSVIDRLNHELQSAQRKAPLLLLEARVYRARAQSLMQTASRKPGGSETKLADVIPAQTDISAAETALLKAIELEPAFRTSHLMLADLYVFSGKLDLAVTRLTDLVAKTNDVTLLLKLGILQEQKGDYPAARANYEKALSAEPNQGAAMNNLAFLYAERFNEIDKAYALAEKARQLRPRDPATADTLGWVLFKRGAYPQALTLLDEAASRLNSAPEVQFHLGMTRYMLGDRELARQALQSAISGPTDFPGKDDARACLAILAINLSTANDEAKQMLEKQLRVRPKDPIALCILGDIQARDGALKAAAGSYEMAQRLVPQNPQIILKLANLYATSELNDSVKALELAKKAHELAPTDAMVSSLLGRLAFQSGNHKWAASLLEESSRKNPDSAQVLYDLAWADYSLGHILEAKSCLERAAKLKPIGALESDILRFLTAINWALDPASANRFEPEIQQVLASHPNYVPALFALGLSREQQDAYPLAADAYRKVLDQFPLFSPACRQLGLLYFVRLAQDQNASDLLSKARENFPDDPELSKALGILSLRREDYSRATQLLSQSAASRQNDAELFYYLGMAQYRVNARIDSKTSLQKALALNITPKLAEDAKRVLTELK